MLRVRVCVCAGLRMRFYLVVHVLELAMHGRRALGEQKIEARRLRTPLGRATREAVVLCEGKGEMGEHERWVQ